MFDLAGVALVAGGLILFGWLSRRAWGARRPAVKWLGATASGMLTLALGVLFGAALLGYWKLNRTHDNPVPQISLAGTPEQIARGARFAPYCGGCHTPDSGTPLTGGDFLGQDAPPIGSFYAPNLTPVHLDKWSDGEIIRAIREGVHRSGRSLLIMPSHVLRKLSDRDVQAIVAYLRSLPPSGTETPANRLNILGAIMANVAPIFEAQPPITGPVVAPPPGPTAEYGAYISSLVCALCHGTDLLGDNEIPAPPLIGIPSAWDERQFAAFMRTGVRPDGSRVDGEAMPWEDLSRFLQDDDDLGAIYARLKELAGG